MDLDPMEAVEATREETEQSQQDKKKSQLNSLIAITIALLATFMGICKVKDDNIVQAMQQAQADKLDHWNYYQARNIREEVANSTLTQLRLQKPAQPATKNVGYDKAIAEYQGIADKQKAEKEKLKTQAEGDQKTYDSLNYHDDQFDLSDALLAIAISLMAVTSLTQKRWLFIVALVPTFFGVLMGLAGLLGWHIHPDALTQLLS